jgi:hypothetical protein
MDNTCALTLTALSPFPFEPSPTHQLPSFGLRQRNIDRKRE